MLVRARKGGAREMLRLALNLTDLNVVSQTVRNVRRPSATFGFGGLKGGSGFFSGTVTSRHPLFSHASLAF